VSYEIATSRLDMEYPKEDVVFAEVTRDDIITMMAVLSWIPWSRLNVILCSGHSSCQRNSCAGTFSRTARRHSTGIPAARWPVCAQCGHSQSLLAQFVHHNQRLDLGREGEMLFIFHCNHDPGMCSTWEGGSGANACFVLEPEDLVNGISPIPDEKPLTETEVLNIEWIAKDDGVPAEYVPAFFAESEYHELPEEIVVRAAQITRLGGVPSWLQRADEAPKNDWRFVFQLDNVYSYFTAPVVLGDPVHPDPDHWEGRSHYCIGPNFGDGGIGYIFLREATPVPQGWFFRQCL